MKITGIILAFVLSFSTWAAAQTRWKVTSYSVSFKIKHVAGAIAEGKFKGLKADIFLDIEQPENAVITATLDANTFETGSGSRDKTMKGEEYFDVPKFPLISMKSTKITSKGNNNYEGVFKITIKSTTKEIPVKFTLVKTGTKGVFSTQFIINRVDFGVGEKSWLLANEATINILVNTEL